MKKKLLLTARDYSSGLNALALAKSPLVQEAFDLCLVFGPAACRLYQSDPSSIEPFSFHKFLASYPESERSEDLIQASIEEARQLIENENPDLLLTGISGTGIGIDEIALRVCKNYIPTLSYQDYWGYINEELDCIADNILLMDSCAKEYTKQDYPGLSSEIVGSLKYDFYMNHIFSDLSDKLSKIYDIPRNYWVFIGQPIVEVKGYVSALDLVLSHAKHYQIPCYYLPHPSVNISDVSEYLPLGYLISESNHFPKEVLLLKSDKIFTCFSTYIIDVLMMKQFFTLQNPDIATINLSEKIKEYKQSFTRSFVNMPIPNDLVFPIENEKEIEFFLQRKNITNLSMNFNSAIDNVLNILNRFENITPKVFK